jgi:hypothetical protein
MATIAWQVVAAPVNRFHAGVTAPSPRNHLACWEVLASPTQNVLGDPVATSLRMQYKGWVPM